jgi:formylglycine-generating enzyme required for sulfatase activity
MKRILIFIAVWLLATRLQAQVNIGSTEEPQSFSVLELFSNEQRGLRLPQLTTAQRDTLSGKQIDITGISAGMLASRNAFATERTGLAMGLQIFNTKTKCVETWNGTEWIQECYNNTPALPPVSPTAPESCPISTSDNLTFTCIADPNAEAYEWFVGNVSKGETTDPTITFATAQILENVAVANLYPPAFLKPTMISVEGSSSWYYGSGNNPTTAVIPDFRMSETPVTQAQFSVVFPEKGTLTPSYFVCGRDVNYAPSSAKPVENVSWYDAIAYCNKLSLKEGKNPVYSVKVSSVEVDWENLTYDGIPIESDPNWDAAACDFSANGYRLPTEWEWEYAARGGTQTHNYTYSGSNSIDEVAWYFDNNGTEVSSADFGTKSVKTKTGGLYHGANELGLYDMSGNILEFCWNWFGVSDPSVGYSGKTPFSTPSGSITSTSGTTRVMRGGSWADISQICLVYRQSGHFPYDRNTILYATVGFRVVLAP